MWYLMSNTNVIHWQRSPWVITVRWERFPFISRCVSKLKGPCVATCRSTQNCRHCWLWVWKWKENLKLTLKLIISGPGPESRKLTFDFDLLHTRFVWIKETLKLRMSLFRWLPIKKNKRMRRIRWIAVIVKIFEKVILISICYRKTLIEEMEFGERPKNWILRQIRQSRMSRMFKIGYRQIKN